MEENLFATGPLFLPTALMNSYAFSMAAAETCFPPSGKCWDGRRLE